MYVFKTGISDQRLHRNIIIAKNKFERHRKSAKFNLFLNGVTMNIIVFRKVFKFESKTRPRSHRQF